MSFDTLNEPLESNHTCNGPIRGLQPHTDFFVPAFLPSCQQLLNWVIRRWLAEPMTEVFRLPTGYSTPRIYPMWVLKESPLSPVRDAVWLKTMHCLCAIMQVRGFW